MSPSSIDVAIIGAGPYGISIASHLRDRGIEFRIFGTPMHTWRTMPPGMFLKSFDFATNIYTPQPHFTFREFCRARGITVMEPISIATFGEYGVWAQQQLVPMLEPTEVSMLTKQDGLFELTLATGERVRARRVIVAAGLSHFERLPEVLAALPPELASHTSQHSDFSRFAGQDVTVVGAGQSALQAAALLHENDVRVQLLVRGWGVWWMGKMPERRPLKARLKDPLSVLGPGRLNWGLQHAPMAAHYLPAMKRVRLVRKHLGPSGAWWLRERVEGKVPVTPYCTVSAAEPAGKGVRLWVHEKGVGERELRTDHVVAGTGFDVDLDRLPFLDRALAAQIYRIERAPLLSRHFETSVPGLYFVGPASAFSFGPLFRFVAGADYTSKVLARRLVAGKAAPSAVAAPEPSEETAEPVAALATHR
jgi:cation diffusion facilitator CzcD-associated flavoprotein CzcO